MLTDSYEIKVYGGNTCASSIADLLKSVAGMSDYWHPLEPTDKLPVGKKPCLSLRELEKQIGYDLDNRLDPFCRNITVNELMERYLATKTGVKNNTRMNYNFVRNIMRRKPLEAKRFLK